jgi:hypothetical protein
VPNRLRRPVAAALATVSNGPFEALKVLNGPFAAEAATATATSRWSIRPGE